MKLSLCAMIAVVLVSITPRSYSQQPQTMMRIIFHEERGPDTLNERAQTYRKILIAGDTLMRAEVLQGGQTRHMLIRNGAELWEANPQSRTAVLRDTAVETMSLSLFTTSKETFVRGLQIGKEKDFFASKKARKLPDETVDTLRCEVYQLDTVNTQLRLWVDKKEDVPVQIAITDLQGEYRVRYDVYMDDVPFDSTVFRVPERPETVVGDSSKPQNY